MLKIAKGVMPIKWSSLGAFVQSIRERLDLWRKAREFEKFLRSLGPLKPFKPCAYYQEVLDMLIVQTKDCSYTLDEKPPFLGGVMYENHVEGKNVVGFQLYGIRHFFHERGLPKKIQREWEVGRLAHWILSERGFSETFGDNVEDVKKLLRKFGNLKVAGLMPLPGQRIHPDEQIAPVSR